MTTRIIHGDCVIEIPKLVADGVVVDAVCCDPPYHLVPTHKRFSKPGSSAASGKDGSYGRLSSGFMNSAWDGGDIAFRPETWETVATIMRPGAFLVAFGGTRTFHRLTCAIEDAGFVIQDCLMWLFATGFPKRRDMLKPAYEPIVLAYKSGGKRTMQIDECRIPIEDAGGLWGNGKSNGSCWSPGRTNGGSEPEGKRHKNGRWPANICHDGSDEVVAMFPDSAGQLFTRPKLPKVSNGIYGSFAEQEECVPRGDTGSSARFFFSAKAGAQDRWGSRHPTVKPVELMKWLVALVTPLNGVVLDPFAGSGTTAVAAMGAARDAILIEREEQYVADIRERVAFYEGAGLHSVQAKNRNRKTDAGPLFDRAYDETADAIGSYNDAVKACGERVKQGEPLPDFFRGKGE